MPHIHCPDCRKQSFEINERKIKDAKKKILVLVCLSCRKPAAVIRSYESINLLKKARQLSAL